MSLKNQYLNKFTLVRLGLIGLFTIITMLQLLSFPGQISHIRRVNGLSLIFEITLTLVVGIWFLCGQICIYFLWRIISLMQSNLFFSQSSLSLINRLVLFLKIAAAVPIVLFLMIAPQADDPGFLVLITAIFCFLFALAMVATLLRDQIKSKV
jgi:hypothetical protein